MYEGRRFRLAAGGNKFIHAVWIDPQVDDFEVQTFAVEIVEGVHAPRTPAFYVEDGFGHEVKPV